MKMVAHPARHVKSLRLLMVSMAYNCTEYNTNEERLPWNIVKLRVPFSHMPGQVMSPPRGPWSLPQPAITIGTFPQEWTD
jgi:hypothetical protein